MKVFVLSCGAVCAAGKNIKEILEKFKSGSVSPSASKILDTNIDNPVFEISDLLNKDSGQRTFTLLKISLAEAFSSTSAQKINFKKYKVGCCFGTTVACQLNDLEFYSEYKTTGNLNISAVKNYLNANLAAEVKKIYNFDGTELTIVNACTSGADAIGTAALWIKNGFCDIAVAGGADEINKIPLSGFNSLNNMSIEKCRPFDKNRSGLNIGEGAGAVILVSEEVIEENKIEPSIELSSYATAADGYHLTAPSPEGVGLSKAIEKALDYSGIKSSDIDFINAHGTSTKDNDLVEGRVFRKIFGDKIKFFSSKGFTGHTLGAAGALEAIFTIKGLQEKWIPKSAGFKNFDEEIGISPVTENTIVESGYAMSTSLAFGGNNSVLIFKWN